MHRRTFLRAAGPAALSAVAGCAVFASTRDPEARVLDGRWQQATGGPGNSATAPSVHASERLWSIDLPGDYATTPVVADGVVVVGLAGGSVFAVDLESGADRWVRETAGVQGTPAISGEWVVVPADDGRLHRYRLADGRRAQPIELGSSLLSPVTVTDGRAFVVTNPSELVAVDVANWQVDWNVALAVRGVGKPAVDGDQVVVSGTRPDGTGDLRSLDSSTGAEDWRVRGTKGFVQTPVVTGDGVTVSGAHDNRLESWTAADDWEPAGAFWFDARGGLERVEAIPGPIWAHCDVRFLTARTDTTTVSGCNALVQYGPDGHAWSRTVPQGVTTRPLATPEGLLVGDAHGRFWLVDEASRSPAFSVDGIPSTPAVLDSGVVVPVDGRLVARVE